MTATYSFPTADFSVEADGSVLQSLEYSCLTCTTKCTSAEVLKLHVEGAKHRKKLADSSIEESADIASEIAKFAELEAPHRVAHKSKKKAAFAVLCAQKKEEKKAMTPEERAEKKRKAEEDGTAPASKKKAKANNVEPGQAMYTCTICNIGLNSDSQMQQHVSSPKHIAKAGLAQAGPEYGGAEDYAAAAAALAWFGGAADDPKAGCPACGLPGPVNKNHFDSRAHKKMVESGAMAEMAAAPPPPTGKKQKGALPAGTGPGSKGEGAAGCPTCGLPGPVNPNHFQSKKHLIAAGLA